MIGTMPRALAYPLILASSSPRRRALLAEAGYDFRAVSPPLSEPSMPRLKEISAAAWAEALAYFKARAVAEDHRGAITIGADTIVVRDNTVIGKPFDEQDARRMLSTMFAGRNDVITGLALVCPQGRKRLISHERSILIMRPMEPEEVEDYLASGAWRAKAGGYALQEGGDKFVQSIQGSRSNIVGLPLERLEQLLEEFGCDLTDET